MPTGEGRLPALHGEQSPAEHHVWAWWCPRPRPVSFDTLKPLERLSAAQSPPPDHLLKSSPQLSCTPAPFCARRNVRKMGRRTCHGRPVWLEQRPVAGQSHTATCGDPLRHVAQSDARRRTPPSTPIHVSESPRRRLPGLRVCERTFFHRVRSLSAVLRAIVGDGARPLATAMWEPKKPLKNQ